MDVDAYRALVVDDEPAIREFCRTILEQIGYAVEVADHGLAALHMLDQNPSFSLLLLDLHMPVMDGVTLLRQARRHGHTLAAVAMTGHGTSENTAEVMQLGAKAILLKPFSLTQLRSVAREILEQRQAERAEVQLATLHPLVKISERLAGQLDQHLLCEQIIATAQDSLAADQVLLVGETDGVLEIVCQANDQLPSAPWQPLAKLAAERRQPIAINADQPPAVPGLQATWQQHSVCVPLNPRWRQCGALLVERQAQPFSPTEIELLMVIGSLAAVALENAQMHSAVARSEAHYRALLEYAPDAVLLLDGNATAVLEVNAAITDLSGYTRDELLAIAPLQLIPDLTIVESSMQRSIVEHEATLIHNTGHSLPVAVGISSITHDEGDYKLLIVRDMSERTRLLRQSIQTEKLAGMGRLSASLAHEINNPLQALQSSLSLLVERAMPEDKRTQILHMAHGQVGQLVGVVQHMMDLYRPTVREGMRPLLLHDLLETVITKLTPRLDEHQIVLERDWASSLPRVRGVSSQLKQVVGSLLLNAIEAMPTGGQLTVRTQLNLNNGRNVVAMQVTNTSGGLTPHELQHMFEPFAGHNAERTGLSLAVSYNIVEQHEGALTVESTVHSTIFTLLLPAL